MKEAHIAELLENMQAFFQSQTTRSVDFRIRQLQNLENGIRKYEKDIYAALSMDLFKSEEEALLTELSIIYQEIHYHIRHLRRWTRKQKVSTPLSLFPAKSYIFPEPLGCVLVMSPWNYPFHLLINPLIGAISAGCCCMLKPSPYAQETSKLMQQIIQETFEPNYICLVQGNREINQILLNQKFDLIFFTGSPQLGKIVYQAAAQNLCPCILELGGKSPCIVDKKANLKLAAKRIIWGKMINAGQTCVAPDYLLVQEDIKEPLVQELIHWIETFFGKHPQDSPFFPRIIRQEAFFRLQSYLNSLRPFKAAKQDFSNPESCPGYIRYGGKTDEENLYISPTLVEIQNSNCPIMQEEIFGPILPILTYKTLDEAVDFMEDGEKPLALYFFGDKTTAESILRSTSSGGMVINDTLIHLANSRLPFGGVGNSGMGKYHGKESFLAFSNRKAVIAASSRIDLPVKYVPFKYVKYLKGWLKK